MSAFFPLILFSLVIIAIGIWQLTAPLDTLWSRQQRYLLSRGLAPQRTSVWEASVRGRAWVLIVTGIIPLLVYAMIMSTTPPRMTGISINGHELTQAEWDACGHDMPTCLTQEVMKPH